MVPPSIRRNLASLRRRERLLTFVWGLARWLAIVLVLLFVCGLIDWLIDRERDTPFFVRLTLTSVLVVVATVAEIFLIMWPQARRFPDDLLALLVEAKVPDFEHRLISAVQLNQPDAQTEGMSEELVAVVTREAEQRAKRVGFAEIADHSRLRWSIIVVAPILLLLCMPVAIWPRVSFALLARQFFFPVDIPHSVELDNESPKVWLVSETIPIRFRVKGAFQAEMEGSVFVRPEGQRGDYYPLKFVKQVGDDALFEAEVKPSTANSIAFSARLADGRTKVPSVVRLVQRPIIADKDHQAWVVLPEYCGKKPSGGRYEKQARPGDIGLIAGSAVRVKVEVQTPIEDARIELLGPDHNIVRETVPMNIKEGARNDSGAEDEIKVFWAEGTFDHADGLTAYRVIVKDKHGFDNAPYPQRTLKLMPEEPPTVTLLRDTFGSGADFDLEGLPVRLGKKIRIPYRCDGPYGLGKAVVFYRLLKKHESGEQPAEDEPWIRLPLSEMKAGPDAGAFEPRIGVFANMKFDQDVPFHAVPSPIPEFILGRTLGGGRVFLNTNGLINTKGETLKLKSKDQIEYCIEVYAMDRKPSESTPSARSETRVVTVMDLDAWGIWLAEVGRQDDRIRQLEQAERGIFEKPK